MSSQQEKQANKKFKAGQDNLTTGIFQWSKDYTSGASNFSEAGNSLVIQPNCTQPSECTTKPSSLSNSLLSAIKNCLSTCLFTKQLGIGT
jgi:hypothetical protein